VCVRVCVCVCACIGACSPHGNRAEGLEVSFGHPSSASILNVTELCPKIRVRLSSRFFVLGLGVRVRG